MLFEKVGSSVCEEMTNPRKALHYYLFVFDGQYIIKHTTEEDRKASLGICANNDMSEGMSGCFSEAFIYCKGMGIYKAAILGQSRFNKDNSHGAKGIMSGNRSKPERDGEDAEKDEVGLFINCRWS